MKQQEFFWKIEIIKIFPFKYKNNGKYNEKIDIFSAGCILGELFLLEPLFPGKIEGMQIFEHMTVLGYPGKDYFKRFNLPTKLVHNFIKIKPKKSKFHYY